MNAIAGQATPRPKPESQPGYRGPVACAVAGITYRQLDYWHRTELVAPSIRPGFGSGTSRLYSARDVVVLRMVKRLLCCGVSMHRIRSVIPELRDRTVEDLSSVVVLSDGRAVWLLVSDGEIAAHVRGGQAVFGINVGQVVAEVREALPGLPCEASS